MTIHYLRAPLAPSELLLSLQIFHNFENPPAPSPIRSTAPDFLDIRPRPRPSGAHLEGLQGLHDPSKALPHPVLPSNLQGTIRKRVHETSAAVAATPLSAHGSTPISAHGSYTPLKTPTSEAHGSYTPLSGHGFTPISAHRPYTPSQMPILAAQASYTPSKKLRAASPHAADATPKQARGGKSKTKEDGEAKERQTRGRIKFEEKEVALHGHTYLTSRKVSGSDVKRAQCGFPIVAREKLKIKFNREMIKNHVYDYLDKNDNSYKASYKEWKSSEALQAQSLKKFYEVNDIKENDTLHIYVINAEPGKEEPLRFRLIKYVEPPEEK